MNLLALMLTALFVVGATYVGIKLRSDWQAGQRGMIVAGVAALIGYLIVLGVVGRSLMMKAGDGFMGAMGL